MQLRPLCKSDGTAILHQRTSRMTDRLTVERVLGHVQVTGQVFEDAQAAYANAGVVPGGTYNDIVVMTVDYN